MLRITSEQRQGGTLLDGRRSVTVGSTVFCVHNRSPKALPYYQPWYTTAEDTSTWFTVWYLALAGTWYQVHIFVCIERNISRLLAVAELWYLSCRATSFAAAPTENGQSSVFVHVLSGAHLTLFGASGLPCTSHWTYIIVPPTTTGTLPRDKMSSMAS